MISRFLHQFADFFLCFHVASALKENNAYKKKGTPASVIFQYLFLLFFSNRSMYIDLLTKRNASDFAKDTVYRFMKRTHIKWLRFYYNPFCRSTDKIETMVDAFIATFPSRCNTEAKCGVIFGNP